MVIPDLGNPRAVVTLPLLLVCLGLSCGLLTEAAVVSRPDGLSTDNSNDLPMDRSLEQSFQAVDQGNVEKDNVATSDAEQATIDAGNTAEASIEADQAATDANMGSSDSKDVAEDWTTTNKQQQQMFWSGTFVYVCFSFLFANLYFQARVRYPKTFNPTPRTEVFPSTSVFSFNLFDLSDANVSIIGLCCPMLRWADTMDHHGLISYWKAFFSTFCFMLLLITVCESSYDLPYIMVAMYLTNVAFGVFYRQKLRDHFQKEAGTFKSLANDVAAWFFCLPCAIIQEAREDAIQRGGEFV